MKLRVTHVEGSKKGTVDNFDLPVVTVGRDPSNVLVFDPVKDDRVSTKHAALSEQGGSLIVTDLGSRNGTLVNGQKIQGPTPVAPGGLVQFGENGPMIMVAYEKAAAPAAAPAPARKSGGGGCVVVALLALLVLGGGLAAAFFFLHGKHGDPWAKCGVGTSFVLSTETHLEKPPSDSKIETKETVVARTEESVKVRTETTVGGSTVTTETEIPRHPPKSSEPAEKPLEEKHESLTVPAGTFDCHYEKRTKDGTTIETWTADGVPVPVKSVVSSEIMKTTSSLVKVDWK